MPRNVPIIHFFKFFIYFLFFILLFRIKVMYAWHQNFCLRVPNMLKYGKYVNMPKRYHLMQKMANTVEVSNFRCIVYLFWWISIKLSIKWALVEVSRVKLTFSYNIGLKTSISKVYCTFMTINQKLFDLESSFWYQIKGIFNLYKYVLSNTS